MESLIKYPVNLEDAGDNYFTAKLVDLPDGPKGSGRSPKAAYNDLATRVIPVLTDLMLKGEAPEPTAAAEDGLVIGLSKPVAFGGDEA